MRKQDISICYFVLGTRDKHFFIFIFYKKQNKKKRADYRWKNYRLIDYENNWSFF